MTGVFAAIFALLFLIGGMFVAFPYSAAYKKELHSLAFLVVDIIKSTRGEWEHCYLVPIAVGAILYFKRQEIAASPMRPCLPGLVLFLFGAGIFYFGRLADIIIVGLFGFQITLMGAVLFLFGWQIFQKVLFPLLFLGFAWPMPFLEAPVAFPLRMIMSELAAGVLNFVGLNVIKVGTSVVSAPDVTLGLAAGQRFAVDIADPCSGIRSLFALTMISALYAYFAVKPLWKQVVVFLCAVPLAVAGNLVRILMLTFGTVVFGAEFAIGKNALTDPSWFHIAAGYLVFVVALCGLLTIGWAVQFDWKNFQLRSSDPDDPRIGTAALPSDSPPHKDVY